MLLVFPGCDFHAPGVRIILLVWRRGDFTGFSLKSPIIEVERIELRMTSRAVMRRVRILYPHREFVVGCALWMRRRAISLRDGHLDNLGCTLG